MPDWTQAFQRYRMRHPRGEEFERRVKLARQGDRLAAMEVNLALASDLRRGTLDAREREYLASMHERIAIGEDPAAATFMDSPPNRRIKTRRSQFIAGCIASEIEDHGAGRCSGCASMTNEAAYSTSRWLSRSVPRRQNAST